MRNLAPHNFDISDFFAGIYTFQGWEMFPGFKTKGKDVHWMMANLGVPLDLTGKRILDIAPWNGFFSFECVRRGAAEVVSLGPDDPELTGYNKTRNLLEIDNCTYLRESVYDLSIDRHGTFDIVFFLGLIYHLRHPLLALDKIYDIARHDLYVDAPIIDNMIFDKTISEELSQKILAEGRSSHHLPLAYFTKNGETGDPYNWFIPNRRCLRDFVESGGFEITRSGDDGGGWAWVSAVKGLRTFAVGVEGFNPAAMRYPANN